jgi:hypothetical protein
MCKSLYSQNDTIGMQWKPLEMGPNGRKLGYWGHALEGDIGSLALSFSSLCFLATVRWAACCTIGPKATVPIDHGLKLPKLQAKISFSF